MTRDEIEAIRIRNTPPVPPPMTKEPWICDECGQWTPLHHPEAHEHLRTCKANTAYESQCVIYRTRKPDDCLRLIAALTAAPETPKVDVRKVWKALDNEYVSLESLEDAMHAAGYEMKSLAETLTAKHASITAISEPQKVDFKRFWDALTSDPRFMHEVTAQLYRDTLRAAGLELVNAGCEAVK